MRDGKQMIDALFTFLVLQFSSESGLCYTVN